MNQQLFEDARNGHIARIVSNLQYNPEMSEWTPLHIACLFGEQNFAEEFLRQNPEFLKLVNPDGCTALHLAASNGHLQIVDFLLKFRAPPGDNEFVDRELCIKKDKDGRNPLHHAVIKQSIGVVKKLLQACPESALELTDQKQTVLHLAVKNEVRPSSRVFQALLDGPYASHLLNLADKKGNTVLHLAIIRKQKEIIKLLIDWGRNMDERSEDPQRFWRYYLDVNAVNSSGLTPLDVLVVDVMCQEDIEIEKMLISEYGRRLAESNEQRENLKSITSGLLVMASLIAAACSQIAVYLQGGFWENSSSSMSYHKYNDDKKKYDDYKAFVFFDSMVLLLSLGIIALALLPNPVKYNFLKWQSLRSVTYLTVGAFTSLFGSLVANKMKWSLREFPFLFLLPLVFSVLILIGYPFFRIMKLTFRFHSRFLWIPCYVIIIILVSIVLKIFYFPFSIL